MAAGMPLSNVLRSWAGMGRKQKDAQIPASWSTVSSFIKASNHLLSVLRSEAQDLLTKSDHLLSPFQDPLSLDFVSNRWFAGSREEGYSDWLCWIVAQLSAPTLIFRLLKINDAKTEVDCFGIRPTIKREMYVEKGHEEQAGRIDLFIHYESKAIIDLEIKVVDAELADLGKNRGYKESMQRFSGKQFHKLLVVRSAKSSYDDYEVLSWHDVCLELRRMVSQKAIKDPLVASIMLTFAGAVEQGILGFSNIKSQYYNPSTLDYLGEFIGESNEYE